MNQQLIDDLLATRRTLAERGRCRVSLTRIDGQVCLDGAVGVALIPGFAELDRRYGVNDIDAPYRALHQSPRALAVLTAISDQINHWPSSTGMPEDSYGTVGDFAEGDPVKACWVFNDWTDATDQDCFDAIDKAIVDAGGMA